MDCFNVKRRRKKEREQKKFQQLTPHTSPSHSQPSSLGPEALPPPPPHHDPRLPKVGSNGLWMGTPGIYAATPSPAYYYSRPGGKGPHANHHLHQHHHGMQRASSESRLPHQSRQVPAGPTGVYAIGGNQQRIYHSQQLAGLTPLYEVVDPRNGSIYDVYQIGGEGSKTKLLQGNSGGGKSHDHRHSKSSKKVQRTNSDAARQPDPARRPHRPKPSHEGHRSSKTSSVTKETAQVHESRDRTSEGKAAGVSNAAFVGSSEKIPEGVKATTSSTTATDSMKLLAKNWTDDEKKVVNPSDAECKKQPSPVSKRAPAPDPDPSFHYTYGGDIYAVPDKEENKRRSRSENPILARMQDMVLDRAEGGVSGQVTDASQTAEPLIVSPTYVSPDHGASLIQNPIYQEAEEGVAAGVQTGADELDSGAQSVGLRDRASGDVTVDDVAASSAVTSLRDAGASGFGRHQEREMTVPKEVLDKKWSVDTDAATDEISRAGKHISVTAEAFEFLDTYLSDEDGVEVQHSPPNSPVLSGREELM